MLDALGMALHIWASLFWVSGCFLCLCPVFLLFLEVWDALNRRCSRNARARKGSASRWRQERRSHTLDAGRGKWLCGCRGPGTFLCYDLSCRPCSEAARERQRCLRAEGWKKLWDSSSRDSSSSSGSSNGSERRKLVPRRGGPWPARPLTQPARDSHAATGTGRLPCGAHPHPRSRLQLGEQFLRRLRMHIMRKLLEILLRRFPPMVRRSHEITARGHVRHAAPAPRCSGRMPRYFHAAEALFLSDDTRETLELHIRAKRLQRQWVWAAASQQGHERHALLLVPPQPSESTQVQLPSANGENAQVQQATQEQEGSRVQPPAPQAQERQVQQHQPAAKAEEGQDQTPRAAPKAEQRQVQTPRAAPKAEQCQAQVSRAAPKAEQCLVQVSQAAPKAQEQKLQKPQAAPKPEKRQVQQPTCPAQEPQPCTALQPWPLNPKREQDSDSEEEEEGTRGTRWSLRDPRRLVIYMVQRFTPNRRTLRAIILRILGLTRIMNGSFD